MSNFLIRWLGRLVGNRNLDTSPDNALDDLSTHANAQVHMRVGLTTPYTQPVSPPVTAEVQSPRMEEVDLSSVEKQIGKLGREQFKLNTLIELLRQDAQSAQRQLSEQNEQHDKVVADLRASHQITLKSEIAEARLQTALRVLPALDGLEDALNSGDRLLDRLRRFATQYLPTESISPPYPATMLMILPLDLNDSLMQRADQADGSVLRLAQIATFDHAELAAMHDAYAALLKGLGIVRTRLLDVLAREGVRPIVAFEQPFNPNRHIAVDVVESNANTPSGYVVSEARRGYTIGDRVLRYSEVIVARQVSDTQRLEVENTIVNIGMSDADKDKGQENSIEALETVNSLGSENLIDPKAESSLNDAVVLATDPPN
jgi:molecular chaperone GrpE (heat shock protein)